LSSNTDENPTFTAPEVSKDTNYTFFLDVNDGLLNSFADPVVVTVKNVDKAPVYNSAKLFKADEDKNVEYLLEGTDVDGDPINFSIENMPSFLKLTKESNTTAVLTGTFTNKYVGDNPFKLTLSDGISSTLETITISVTNTDDAPYVLDSIKNISVDKKSLDKVIDLKTVFEDDDLGDILTYTVTSNKNENVVNAKITGSILTLSFSASEIGTSELLITASSNGKEAHSKFNVEVKIPTGIDLLTYATDVQIYPNPTKGIVQLKFTNFLPNVDTWITVYSASGQLISKSLVRNKDEFLNLKGNLPGIYFIKIDQKNSKTYKLILN
jgi:hypothetical protein